MGRQDCRYKDKRGLLYRKDKKVINLCVLQGGEGRGWRVHRKGGGEEVKGKGMRESYIQKLRWSLYTPMYS